MLLLNDLNLGAHRHPLPAPPESPIPLPQSEHQPTSHGDEAVLLLLNVLDLNAQPLEARVQASLELREVNGRARNQRRLFQEDLREVNVAQVTLN